MFALWLRKKVQTSKRQPSPVFFCCCKFVSVFYKGPSVCAASVYMLVSVWCTSVCFLVVWELQEGEIFSSSFQWLLVPIKETDLHKNRVHVSTTPTHSTRRCQEPSKKWPKSNQSCLTGNKNNPWQTSKPATHESGCETWERNWNAEWIQGIRNELWGVQPCSRANFTEGPKWKGKKSHTHTGAGQIPISSLHMLSTNVNLELMKRSWSKSYWFWDSLKGINHCLVEIK